MLRPKNPEKKPGNGSAGLTILYHTSRHFSTVFARKTQIIFWRCSRNFSNHRFYQAKESCFESMIDAVYASSCVLKIVIFSRIATSCSDSSGCMPSARITQESLRSTATAATFALVITVIHAAFSGACVSAWLSKSPLHPQATGLSSPAAAAGHPSAVDNSITVIPVCHPFLFVRFRCLIDSLYYKCIHKSNRRHRFAVPLFSAVPFGAFLWYNRTVPIRNSIHSPSTYFGKADLNDVIYFPAALAACFFQTLLAGLQH